MFKPYGTFSIQTAVKPEVRILPDALAKMKFYVKHCSSELGWLGTCVHQDNAYLITDVYLFEQKAHGATCEISETDVAKFMEDILCNNANGMEICNSIKVWGHSHVNMQVTPSGQDEVQFKELAKNSDDFFIRIIANKQGDLRLDLWDIGHNVMFNNIQWEVHYNTTVDEEAIKAEVKEKVKGFVTTYARPTTPYYGARYGGNAIAQANLYEEDYEKWYYGTYSEGTQLYETKNKQEQQARRITINDLRDCEKPSDLLKIMSEDDIFTLSCNAKREAYFAVIEIFPSLKQGITIELAKDLLKLAKQYTKRYETTV